MPLVRVKGSRYGFGMRPPARGPLLAAGACFLAFGIVLACAYAIAPIGRWDATALHGLMGLNSYDVGEPLAHSADPLPIALALAALFAWGWALGRRREALAALALVAGAASGRSRRVPRTSRQCAGVAGGRSPFVARLADRRLTPAQPGRSRALVAASR